MERESSNGLTAEYLKENIRMTKSRESGSTFGLMVGNTLESGKMECSMVEASSLRKESFRNSESGSLVSE